MYFGCKCILALRKLLLTVTDRQPQKNMFDVFKLTDNIYYYLGYSAKLQITNWLVWSEEHIIIAKVLQKVFRDFIWVGLFITCVQVWLKSWKSWLKTFQLTISPFDVPSNGGSIKKIDRAEKRKNSKYKIILEEKRLAATASENIHRIKVNGERNIQIAGTNGNARDACFKSATCN